MIRRWWRWLLERPALRLGSALALVAAIAVLAAVLLPGGSSSPKRVSAGPTTSASESTAAATTTTVSPTTSSTAASTTGASTTSSSRATVATRPASTAAPTTGPAPSYPWPQFGQGAARSGVAASGPNPAGAHLHWRTALDGAVYAEPLAGNGLVIAATENDTVYGLRAGDGAVVWQQHLGSPVPRSSLPCGDIDPSGITGTPAIDTATGTLYVVAFVQPQRHDLVALNVASGQVRWRRTIDPPGLSASVEQERGALILANGRVYVPFGGLYGDCGAYKGAVVASALSGSGSVQAWIAPAQREAGVWAPGGGAVDPAGNLFVATGNGSSSDPAAYDGGNSVFRLTSDLHQADSFAPSDWATLAASDTDLGSTSPLLVSNGEVFIAGKDGNGYLLNGQHLGGIGGQQFSAPACPGGAAFGGSAWADPMIVLNCNGGPVGLRVDRPGHFSPAWSATGGLGGAPSIASGVAWVVQRRGHLVAVDLGSGAVRADLSLGGSVPGFPSPAILPDLAVAPAGAAVAAFGD
jgi:outer membrane protein assembly factor BamB